MSKLVLVKPVTITPAMLVSTTVTEADYPVWVVGTTYALADRVIVISTNKIYESLQATNLGKNPTTQTAWWIEVSPTNRWKLFDTSNSTQTVKANNMSYTIRPGQAVTAVAILNLSGITSIRVRIVDPSYGTVYDKTTSLPSLPSSPGWWEWFFSIRTGAKLTFATDLPSFPSADIIVDILGTTELAVGVLLLGQTQVIGLGTQIGARIGIQDYSRKEKNEYGDTVLVQRAFAKRASFTMLVDNSVLDATQEVLSSVRATPCLWIGVQDYGSTVIYGFFKEFDLTIAYSNYSDCSIEIEGLT